MYITIRYASIGISIAIIFGLLLIKISFALKAIHLYDPVVFSMYFTNGNILLNEDFINDR